VCTEAQQHLWLGAVVQILVLTLTSPTAMADISTIAEEFIKHYYLSIHDKNPANIQALYVRHPILLISADLSS
jgi:TusA-related sulfurtransferase